MTYSFGPFELDVRARRLRRGGDVVAVPDRHLDVLVELVANSGRVVSKDALIASAWNDVAVTDNSLEQAISALRRTLGTPPAKATAYIETVARRGYRFVMATTIAPTRSSDESLSALLAPYRALVEGRAALETLDRDAIVRARDAFETMIRTAPDYAPAHLGLANALALEIESVRAERRRDDSAVARAVHHASEACRLEPTSGEAWAALSLSSFQARDVERAIAAAQRAAALEPDNWRHHLRLAYVSWGESRLRAAHRVLKLFPAFPFAHWLAATVHVARQAFEQAEEELVAGAAAQDRQPESVPFKSVGLHLLLGLVRLATGDEAAAAEQFGRELAIEPSRHIYGREACANAFCAMAAIHLRHGRIGEAIAAFERANNAVAGHAMASAGLAATSPRSLGESPRVQLDARLAELREQGAVAEAAVAEAVYATLSGDHTHAAHATRVALERAPIGSAGWSIPVEPLLHVQAHPDEWQAVLTLVRSRAS